MQPTTKHWKRQSARQKNWSAKNKKRNKPSCAKKIASVLALHKPLCSLAH